MRWVPITAAMLIIAVGVVVWLVRGSANDGRQITLRVEVIDSDGQPIPMEKLNGFQFDITEPNAAYRYAATDADGVFVMENVRVGSYTVVMRNRAGFEFADATINGDILQVHPIRFTISQQNQQSELIVRVRQETVPG